MIPNGCFSQSPCGSQLLCAPSYKASQEGFITCAWFFGPQGVVEISPLYYREHHNVITLRSYSTLACVPISQGQAIPAVPTNCSSTSVQGYGNRDSGIYNMCLVLRSSRSGRDLAPLLSRASQRNYSSELFNPCLCSYQPRSSHSCCPDKLLKYICARIWQQGLREMPFFDHMERRERIMMDEEENRQVYVPACDKSLLEVHVNP